MRPGAGQDRAASGSGQAARAVRDALGRLLAITPTFSRPMAILYGALWCVMLVIGASYVQAPLPRPQVSSTFVHQILSMANLVFHEAGHVIFSVLGSFVATAGGSLISTTFGCART